jgi:salicylate hydroxylase
MDLNANNPEQSNTISLAIIGGGIAGLSLLLGILEHCNVPSSPSSPSNEPRKVVIKPHLYESATAFSEIGAGVGFGPNATNAMRIVSPALYDTYVGLATDAEIISDDGDGKKKAVWNELIMGMDGRGNGSSGKNKLKAGDKIARVLYQGYKKNVHRARFLEGMIGLLPGGTGEGYVSFRKRCIDVEYIDEKIGGVKIKFADGSEARADAVIGCDGVKSRVRQILLSRLGDQEAIQPRFTGKYAYRGLIPMGKAVEAIGPIARKSHMIWGYDGHFVCFPIDKGQTLNVVAFQTKKDGQWQESDWVIPGTIPQALEDYKDWSEPVKNLIRGLRKPDIWALFEHPPARSYWDGEGKICLLGDCAHAR